MSPTLHARDLCKKFGAREAVRDVRIAVGPGEVVGLLGPNGAGKTTTFNMIVGRVRPTSGRVFLGEEEITDLPMYMRARKGITYLPQEPSIFRKLTVEENVLAILETLDLPRRERKQRAHDLLAELNEPIISATLSLPGEPAPLSDAQEIRQKLERRIDLVIDAGSCGTEPSTVIDLTEDPPIVARVGKGSLAPFAVERV